MLTALVVLAGALLLAFVHFGRLGPAVAVILLAVAITGAAVLTAMMGQDLPFLHAFRNSTGPGRCLAWILIVYYLACESTWRLAQRRKWQELEDAASTVPGNDA